MICSREEVLEIADKLGALVKHDYDNVVVLYSCDEAKQVVAALYEKALDGEIEFELKVDSYRTVITLNERDV